MVLIYIPGFIARAANVKTKSKMADPKALVEAAFTRPTVTVVVLPPFDDQSNIHSERSILQIASYSPSLGWFNFYDVSPTCSTLRRPRTEIRGRKKSRESTAFFTLETRRMLLRPTLRA